MATCLADHAPNLAVPKLTSSFDRQAPPPVEAEARKEGKSQSPQRGGGAAAGGNSGGGQGRGGQGHGQGQDYYTLSRAGITHLKDSSSDFTTLDRWEREYALFHQIRRLGLKTKAWWYVLVVVTFCRRGISAHMSKRILQAPSCL